MSKILKFKRGTTAKNNAYVGSDGELTVDTNKKTVVVHDGLTNGGSVLATELIVSNHTSRVDNPHNVTKSQVGLGNVQNIDSTIASNISQDSTHRFVTDSEKTIWNNKINLTEKASANGVATLDSNGKVVLTQIPDSVLGQLQYIGVHNFSYSLPTATEKGQYWIASTDGNGYMTGDWAVYNGSTFDKVDNTDAVASVAGKTGNVVLTKNDVGLNNVDNTSDTNKPVSTAQQTALNLKANIASPTFTGTVTAPTFYGSLSGNASSAINVAWSGVTSKPTTISGYGITDAQPLDGDLTAIAGLAGTSGILKKTAVDTWVLDTNTYVTSSGVTSVTGNAPIVSSGGNTPSISISAATTSAPGSMSAADKTKLDGIASLANNYTHPTGDGNLHVPATGTTNNGKVLTAGATAGSLSWTAIPSAPVSSVNGMTGDVVVTTITGNAATATKLQAARTIGITGDLTWTSPLFDGSGNITAAGTLANSGVTAGTYTKVTVDAKGRATAGALMTLEDIPDSTFKKSVRCATTANLAATYSSNVLTMSAVGVTTIDGITVALNDRILIKDQTTALQNGIYRVSTLGTASVATVFTRVADADATSELASALVAVDSGTVNGGRLFDNDLKTTDTLGTTAVTFNLVVDTGFASTVVGSTPGTAAIGTSTSYARADHVHPVQTTISGNITSTGNTGFKNDAYVTGARNPIWYFANAPTYGISYYQSTAGIGGKDVIAFDFGTNTSATSKFSVTNDGNLSVTGTISSNGVVIGTLAEFTAALG